MSVATAAATNIVIDCYCLYCVNKPIPCSLNSYRGSHATLSSYNNGCFLKLMNSKAYSEASSALSQIKDANIQTDEADYYFINLCSQ